MSHVFAGILGAAAMSVAFGAVQFASGSSLTGEPAAIAATAQSNSVNRSVKSDRSPVVARTPSERTISVNLAGLTDTSVLVRIPANVPAKKMSPVSVAPKALASNRQPSTVACEPVVSVLTDVAKLLGPGRCVT
jgi:hypothetical protein